MLRPCVTVTNGPSFSVSWDKCACLLLLSWAALWFPALSCQLALARACLMLTMFQADIHWPQGWGDMHSLEGGVRYGWESGRQAHTFSVGHRQRDLHASSRLGLAEGRSAGASAGKPWPLRTHRNARLSRGAGLGGGASAMSIDMICNNGKALSVDGQSEIVQFSKTF